ncbi:hypothetical protein ACNUDM_06415 [Vibrio chaetopteri]|uniref:hypothetical protein n=1 Tax=Vibrio TaxID=662 RepID=UPI003AB44DA2
MAKHLETTKRLTIEFVRYFAASVLVLGINGELFNIGLRVWSEGEMSFYSDGLWGVSLFLAFVLTCCVMFNKYCPE